MDISELDLMNIGHFSQRVMKLIDYRKALHEYLLSKMHSVAPNLCCLIGEQVSVLLFDWWIIS